MSNIKEPFFPSWMGPYPRVAALWTSEEKIVLKQAYLQGEPLADIMKRHGRAANGVNAQLQSIFGESFESDRMKKWGSENVAVQHMAKKQVLINELCNVACKLIDMGMDVGSIRQEIGSLSQPTFNGSYDQSKICMAAKNYINSGYAVIDRERHIVARVDKADWKDVMKRVYCHTSPCDIPDESAWPDVYRRCQSKDKLCISEKVCELMPDSTGYLVAYKPVMVG